MNEYWNYDPTTDYDSVTLNSNMFGSQLQGVRTSFGNYDPTRDVLTLGEQVRSPNEFSESIYQFKGTDYLANPTVSHNALEVYQGLRDQLQLLPGNLYQELLEAVAQGGDIGDQWLQDASAYIEIPLNFL